MRVIPYTEEDAALWDELAARAPMATFLQTRAYLSYHRDRFKDASLMLKNEKGALVCLFPAAVDPDDSKRVVSHPGITYGGMLHEGKLRGQRMLDALHTLKDYYAGQGFARLRYKAVPYIYHQAPSSDDLYCLFRLGARRYRCDLSSAIDVCNRQTPSERRRRGFKKARKEGVQVTEGVSFAATLWEVLEENLATKYKQKPVHTFDEILLLNSLFPKNIEFVVAHRDAEVLAGVVLFISPRVVHSQYITSSVRGYEVSALDAVFEYCVDKARTQGARYFNFGISTEDNGQYLNADLYQFKSEFGGGGVIHEFYEVDLKS